VRSDIIKHRGGLAPWQAKRLAAYIESNISRNLRVADLAGIVQLSISHFSRAFRKSFGRPPLAYVKVRRVRHAQTILLNTREPIAQVALDCGMCDQAHFTRVFRRVVGISPSLWRRQFQSDPMRTILAQDTRWRPESAGGRMVAGESLPDDYG
jgi:AraC family transcriptional regulator